MADATEAIKCWYPISCADTYAHTPLGYDADGQAIYGNNGALTFVCIWCRLPTPWCCGGGGDALDDQLCDRCWCERHLDIEAEIARESREMEGAHG